MSRAVLAEDESCDALLRGRFSVIQGRTGHRAGLDALLLAAVVPENARGHLVDLGAGCGTVAFAALTRAPGLAATLVEREAVDCDRAARATALLANMHLAGRVRIVAGAAEEGRTDKAEFVLANPPYNDARMQPSANEARARAHEGDGALLDAWVRTAARIAKPGATVAFILRAASWTDAAAAFSARDLGDIRLLPVSPREGEAAHRIIVIARKARRTAPSILPPLVLHEADGRFTPAVAAVLDGEHGLFDAEERR